MCWRTKSASTSSGRLKTIHQQQQPTTNITIKITKTNRINNQTEQPTKGVSGRALSVKHTKTNICQITCDATAPRSRAINHIWKIFWFHCCLKVAAVFWPHRKYSVLPSSKPSRWCWCDFTKLPTGPKFPHSSAQGARHKFSLLLRYFCLPQNVSALPPGCVTIPVTWVSDAKHAQY